MYPKSIENVEKIIGIGIRSPPSMTVLRVATWIDGASEINA